MSYIKVDSNKFEVTASEIDEFIKFLKGKMIEADNEIINLGAAWEGRDFSMFKVRWDTVNDNDSVYYKMISALESYADYLRFAGKRYKETQAEAINNATNLVFR